MSLTHGMKGCGGCHKLGLKSEEAIAALKEEGSLFGHASCDACTDLPGLPHDRW